MKEIINIIVDLAIFIVGISMIVNPEGLYKNELSNLEYQVKLYKGSILEGFARHNLEFEKKHKTFTKIRIRVMGILFILLAVVISGTH